MNRTQPLFIVQVSSKNWAGGPDFQMSLIDGKPVVYHTIAKIYKSFPKAKIVAVAPEFDRNGGLEFLKGEYRDRDFSLFYGHTDNPMKRILAATDKELDQEYFIRVDGISMFFDLDKSVYMLRQAQSSGFDLYMFPHDFPVQFVSEVFRFGAFRSAYKEISGNTNLKRYLIHPKYYIHRDGKYKSKILTSLPDYSDDYLNQCRSKAVDIYNVVRQYTDHGFSVDYGNQLAHHYHVAKEYLTSEMNVLDIACGDGNGSEIIAEKVKSATGADIDHKMISQLNADNEADNVRYVVANALDMDFNRAQFDAVCCMETIEHIDGDRLLEEIHRVLKPGGVLILSTPQNSLGHIPVNAEHIREYSLEELTQLVIKRFRIKRVIGLKAGTISFEDDPVGRSTIIIGTKTNE